MRRAAALAVLVALGGCGGEEPPAPAGSGDPFEDVERQRAGEDRAPRAAPRWERVATLRGSGPARSRVEIADGAIQWRARWSCRDGRLAVTSAPSGARPASLVDAACPASGEASAVTSGRLALDVTARGPWRLAVEQQVDTPLREPAPAAVRSGAAREVASAPFFSVERRTRGRARLFRLPDGRLALRLERFVTAASADLFVWVSRSRRPRTSRAALAARHRQIGPLKATAGDHTYLLPRDVGEDDARSVVIWCEPVRIAYGAAALGRA